MTFKEWTAIIQIAGVILIGFWIWRDFNADPAAFATINAAASRLVWLTVGVIIFNIVATIVVAILVSIAQGRELKDESDDERDRNIIARSSRNAYYVASIACAIALLALAFGFNELLAVFGLFFAAMLAGATDAVSRLIYYRLG